MKSCPFLLAALCALCASADIRELSFMTAQPAKVAPRIDGALTDACWADGVANTAYYEYLKEHPKRVTERETSCTVVYDGKGVYVGVVNREPEMKDLKKNILKNRDAKIWTDDSAEIYFDPHANGIMFYKFVVNANGKWDSSWRMDSANYHADWTFPGIEAAAMCFPDRWELELFVPWAAFGVDGAPKAGSVWTFDHNRFLWLRRSWPLCSSSAPGASYASPEKFGYLYFSDGSVPEARNVLDIVEKRLSCHWGIQIGERTYLHDDEGTRAIDGTLQEVFERIAADERREQAEAATNMVRLLTGTEPVAPLALPFAGRYDFREPADYDGFSGYYRHNPRPHKYVTPHPEKVSVPNPPRVLFMTGFGGEIRDMLELSERFEMEALFFPGDFGQTGIYSDFLSLGTYVDKDRQFQGLLARRPDVTVLKGFSWAKVPAKYRTELVRRVRDEGMGLVFLGGAEAVSKLVKKDEPRRLGKGVILATNRDADPRALVDASGEWILTWREKYEARAKRLFALIREAQGRDDFRAEPPKADAPRAGRLLIRSRDNVVRERERVTVDLSFEKPLASAATLEVEVRDLPYRELVRTESFAVPAGTRDGFSLVLGPERFPTLAGFVSARLVDAAGEAAHGEKVYYFPNHRFDDYTLIMWDGVNSGCLPPLFAPQLIDELGYFNHLGESGNMSALFNGRAVPYAARVAPINAESGATKWGQLEGFTLGWGNKRAKPMLETLKAEGEINPNDPRVIRLIEEEFPFKVTNTARYGVCVWSLGDECGFSYEAGHGKTDAKPFADFLAAKYGSVEKFNAVHGTNVASFAAAPHKRIARAQEDGDWPAWWDHVQYMDKTYSDTFKLLSKVIKRTDPEARVGAEGSQAGDLEQTVDGLEFWGPYRDLMKDEVLRNIAADRVRGIWWGGYPDAKRDGYPLQQWEYVLTGTINGDMWFQADPASTMGCIAGDFSFPPYVERMLPHLKALRRGIAQTLIHTPFRNDGFALYYSYASEQASRLDDAFTHPKNGFVPLIRFCYRKGYDVRVITPGTLDKLKDVRVLFLPGCTVLSDRELAAISAFAKKGGLVVADSVPGRLDGFFVRRAAPPGFLYEKAELSCVASDDAGIAAYDGRMQAILSSRGISNHESISGLPLAQTVFRVRETKGVRLVGFKTDTGALPAEVSISLDRPGYVYEVDRGFVGHTDRIAVKATVPFMLFAVFDERQEKPDLLRLRQGGVYRLMAFGPDGREILHRAKVFRADAQADVLEDFFIPLDEQPGTTSRIRDIATGLESEIRPHRPVCDVCVVGGGPAGVAAALSAARTGAETALVEQDYRLGGTLVNAGVVWPALFHAWGRQVIDGPGWEWITNSVREAGGSLPDYTKDTDKDFHWRHQVNVNGPIVAAVADEMLAADRVDVRFGTTFKSAVRVGELWTVSLLEGGVERQIRCRELIDCTGNGTVAAACGGKRMRDDLIQPGTFVYRLNLGCDWRTIDAAALRTAWKAALARGEVQPADTYVDIFDFVKWRGQNFVHIPGADNSTPARRAETNRRGQAAMLRMLRFLRKQPGLEKCTVEMTAAETGVRETFRVKGRYVLTGRDYVSGRDFEDAVCHSFYPIDLHENEVSKQNYLKPGTLPKVPYRCLLPEGVEHLLLAGRCVSSDREANSALRVQASCMATGQAAGTAAALAARKRVPPSDISSADLSAALRRLGAIVP